MTSIPTEADFKRAKRRMRERFRGVDEVSQSVVSAFETRVPLHYFYLMPQRNDFRAYVFYNTDEEVRRFEALGLNQEIRDFVYTELERVGRGARDQIHVEFEFDSYENVEAKYEGDYFLRLR